MPYITTHATPRTRQLTLEEVLAGEVDVSHFNDPDKHGNTVTRIVPGIPERLLAKVSVAELIQELQSFCTHHDELFKTNRRKLYTSFHIPKKSGGLRRIDAPNDQLKAALYELKALFETKFFALHHTSAFAYVANRSTVDVLKRHQQNGSRWFLKLDFSNFFGSTTENFLFDQLATIFPFSEVVKVSDGAVLLRKVLSLCLLDGGLPQGTPISPMLTNLMMIPIDHQIANGLRQLHMIYTRYADDILISCQHDFNYKKIAGRVVATLRLFHAPFSINEKKTHYGSSSGNNWCLGLMLNGQNEITIGWRNVDRFKAMCNSYILDHKNGVRWELHDVQVFSGLISYYLMVERDYINHVIQHYNNKYQTNMMELIRKDLAGE